MEFVEKGVEIEKIVVSPINAETNRSELGSDTIQSDPRARLFFWWGRFETIGSESWSNRSNLGSVREYRHRFCHFPNFFSSFSPKPYPPSFNLPYHPFIFQSFILKHPQASCDQKPLTISHQQHQFRGFWSLKRKKGRTEFWQIWATFGLFSSSFLQH